jgi:hypothetical protein
MSVYPAEINIDPTLDFGSEWGVNMTIFAPLGQSFTAGSDHIRFIGMYVSTSPNIPPVQFQLRLLEGDGTSGPLLATRYATASPGLFGFLYFGFSGTKLTIGNVYTAVIAQDPPVNATNSSELLGTSNVYPGGTAFSSGTANNNLDCYFRVLCVIYTAQVQPPLKADGSSIITRGEHVRIGFTLQADGAPTCDLPPAKLWLRLLKDPSTVLLKANFHREGCEYVYHLPTGTLTPGIVYEVLILIHDVDVGSVQFGVK